MKEHRRDRFEHISQIVQNMPTSVYLEHNHLLSKLVELQEVEEVVNHMENGKSPGPDGFKTKFFHHFWDLIKMKFWRIVEDSRHDRGVL